MSTTVIEPQGCVDVALIGHPWAAATAHRSRLRSRLDEASQIWVEDAHAACSNERGRPISAGWARHNGAAFCREPACYPAAGYNPAASATASEDHLWAERYRHGAENAYHRLPKLCSQTVCGVLVHVNPTGEHGASGVITLQDAENRGLTQCPRCFPPTAPQAAAADRLWMSSRRRNADHHRLRSAAEKTDCGKYAGLHDGVLDNGQFVDAATIASLNSKPCRTCWPTS